MSILVLGAGELGTAILHALTSHPSRPPNSQISVLLRPSTITSPDAAKSRSIAHIKSLGISLETCDVVTDSLQSLAHTFAKYDTVISCTGFVGPAGTQLRICQAALLAKVRRYFPWQFGVDYDAIGRGSSQPLFDEQLDVRALLRAQGATEWVIVSTGLFMSFLFVEEFGVVDFRHQTLRALGGWEVEVTLTQPDDIARMTAEVVFDPRGVPGQGRNVVYVAGDTVSYAAVADMVEARFSGVAFSRDVWDMDSIRESLVRDPGNTWNKYRGIFGAGRGVSWSLETTLNHERGIEMESLWTCLERMETPASLK